MSIDKRILKTKAGIKNAYMQLAVEKKPNKITITDISEKADINRSTFYLHYKDVKSVAADIEYELSAKISADLEAFDITDIYGSICRLFTNLTAALEETELLRQYLLFSKEAKYISERLKEIFIEAETKALKKARPAFDADGAVYQLTFTTAGVIESFLKWAHAENEVKPLDELIKETSVIVEFIFSKITA